MTTADVRNLAGDIAKYTSSAACGAIGSSDLNTVTAANGNLYLAQNGCMALQSGVDLNGQIASAASDIIGQIGTLSVYLAALVAAIQAGPAPTFIAMPDPSSASAACTKINGDLSTIRNTADQIDANAASATASATAAAQAQGAAQAAQYAAYMASKSTPTPTTTTSTAITTITPTLPSVPAATPVTSAPPPAMVTGLSPIAIGAFVVVGAVLVGAVIMHASDVPKTKTKKKKSRK
jgi:hypothetical protein